MPTTRHRGPGKPKPSRACAHCGGSFSPRRDDARYCGEQCRSAARHVRTMAGREKLPPGMVPGSRPAEEHPAYRGDEVGYWAVHKRLRATRGPASDHVCACGAPAHDWAYLGEREPGDRFPFSTDLDLYEAMCRSCHVRHDRAVA